VVSVVNKITVHAEDVTDRQIAEMARKDIFTYPFFTIFDWATLFSPRGRADRQRLGDGPIQER
jgi:hypothetical protein